MNSKNLQNFPTETLQLIFSFLTTYELKRSCLTCKRFAEIISNFNLPQQSTLNILEYNKILEEKTDQKWFTVTFSEAMCYSFPEEVAAAKSYSKFWKNIGKYTKTLILSSSNPELLKRFNFIVEYFPKLERIEIQKFDDILELNFPNRVKELQIETLNFRVADETIRKLDTLDHLEVLSAKNLTLTQRSGNNEIVSSKLRQIFYIKKNYYYIIKLVPNFNFLRQKVIGVEDISNFKSFNKNQSSKKANYWDPNYKKFEHLPNNLIEIKGIKKIEEGCLLVHEYSRHVERSKAQQNNEALCSQCTEYLNKYFPKAQTLVLKLNIFKYYEKVIKLVGKSSKELRVVEITTDHTLQLNESYAFLHTLVFLDSRKRFFSSNYEEWPVLKFLKSVTFEHWIFDDLCFCNKTRNFEIFISKTPAVECFVCDFDLRKEYLECIESGWQFLRTFYFADPFERISEVKLKMELLVDVVKDGFKELRSLIFKPTPWRNYLNEESVCRLRSLFIYIPSLQYAFVIERQNPLLKLMDQHKNRD